MSHQQTKLHPSVLVHASFQIFFKALVLRCHHLDRVSRWKGGVDPLVPWWEDDTNRYFGPVENKSLLWKRKCHEQKTCWKQIRFKKILKNAIYAWHNIWWHKKKRWQVAGLPPHEMSWNIETIEFGKQTAGSHSSKRLVPSIMLLHTAWWFLLRGIWLGNTTSR